MLKTVPGMRYHLKHFHFNAKQRNKSLKAKKILRKGKVKVIHVSNKANTGDWLMGDDGWRSVQRGRGYGGRSGDIGDSDDGGNVDSLSSRTVGTVELDKEKIKQSFQAACSVKCPMEVCTSTIVRVTFTIVRVTFLGTTVHSDIYCMW